MDDDDDDDKIDDTLFNAWSGFCREQNGYGLIRFCGDANASVFVGLTVFCRQLTHRLLNRTISLLFSIAFWTMISMHCNLFHLSGIKFNTISELSCTINYRLQKKYCWL